MQDQCFHNYRELYPTFNTKAKGYLNWSHFLRRNCLLKLVIEVKTEERTEVTIRRRRRLNKQLDDLTEKRKWSKLKQEAPDRTLCRRQFGGVYGPVVSQTRGYMKGHRSRVYLKRSYPQDITRQNAWDVLYKPRATAGTEAN